MTPHEPVEVEVFGKTLRLGAARAAEFASAACRGKVTIDTPEAAEEAAAHVRRAHGGTATAYRCCHCGQWHVGRRIVPNLSHKSHRKPRRASVRDPLVAHPNRTPRR